MNAFFDTNVLAYASDDSEPVKKQIVQNLLNTFTLDNPPCISKQVLLELFNTLTKKFRVPAEKAKKIVLLYEKFRVTMITIDDINNAMDFAVRWQLAIWDAMILYAAQKAGCSVVYSEDFNTGQKYGSVKVINPFKQI